MREVKLMKKNVRRIRRRYVWNSRRRNCFWAPRY